MMNVRRTILRLLMTAVAVAWAGGGNALYAQNAMGDGRVLDRNLQVGSGGVNPQAAPRTPSIGNSIVTGNVSGLGYFHGNANWNEFYAWTGPDHDIALNALELVNGVDE